MKLEFEANRKKVKYCPCGKSNKDGKFAPYKGYENKGYCHSCGETFLPELKRESFQNKQISLKSKKEPIAVIKKEILEKLIEHTQETRRNHFIMGLKNQFNFSEEQLDEVVSNYHLVNLTTWNGAVGFPYIDIDGNFRQLKSMDFDQYTCKRIKDPQSRIRYIGKKLIADANAKLSCCFFGEHLLIQYPNKPIAIVESEKTAVVASVYYPEFVWLATGGKNGCKWKEKQISKPLTNIDRQVFLFPDLNAIQDWRKAKYEIENYSGYTQIELIDLKKFSDGSVSKEAIEKGYDLADFLTHMSPGEFFYQKSCRNGEQTVENYEKQDLKSYRNACETPEKEISLVTQITLQNDKETIKNKDKTSKKALNILNEVFEIEQELKSREQKQSYVDQIALDKLRNMSGHAFYEEDADGFIIGNLDVYKDKETGLWPVDDLETFFNSCLYPEYPVKYCEKGFISDIESFVEQRLLVVKEYNGEMVSDLPFAQLLKLKKIIQKTMH